MLSDACFEFLKEVVLDDGFAPSALERFLAQLRHYSDDAFGYSAPLLATLHDYGLGVMEDVVEDNKDSVLDFVWVVQCVQRAYDAPPAGESGEGINAGAGAEHTFEPRIASLQWIVNEAVVRRIGRLTMLAQVAASGTSGHVPGSAGGNGAGGGAS